ncbi:MAG: SCO family protein [Beijerinckiaceae bacterium]|nr:SCO family protein [Beijerinckiaceae bacterium]
MKHGSKKFIQKKASRHLLYVILGFAIGLVGLAGLGYAVMPGRGHPGFPAIGSAFAMIGHDGRVVGSADLAGRPYLVFFGYTHCPDFCPTALLEISAIFKELGPDKKITALFVTVDPERDTPDGLKSYLENFDSRIVGLTGDAQKTEDLAKAFGVYAKQVKGERPGDYTVDHTGLVYLMDKRGRFAGAFNLQRPPQQAARELEAYL